jgi:hypothetical protein
LEVVSVLELEEFPVELVFEVVVRLLLFLLVPEQLLHKIANLQFVLEVADKPKFLEVVECSQYKRSKVLMKPDLPLAVLLAAVFWLLFSQPLLAIFLTIESFHRDIAFQIDSGL